MVFAQPVERILHHEAAYAGAALVVVVHRLAPRGVVARGKVWPKKAQIIALVAKMVVDHVENDRQSAPVRLVDQKAQPFRTAVACLHGIESDAVISPIPLPGKALTGMSSIAVTPSRLQVVELAESGV